MKDKHDLLPLLKGYSNVIDIRKLIESMDDKEVKEAVIEYLLSRGRI